MKHLYIILIIVIYFLIPKVHARSYPIHNITLDDCTNNCEINLPRIYNADYQKYRYNITYRKVYSMLYGTTYFDGRDLLIGSHQGIDIATKEGTQVFATHSGKVILAEAKGERGLVVTIEHEIQGKKIYTSYAHLSKILVSNGQYVKEGELIGLVGNTGNSTGPHLHFQIETNQNGEHPFFFNNCPGTIKEIVNEGRCQEQMYQYTVDPILFLENSGNIALLNNLTDDNYNYSTPTYNISGFQGGAITTYGLQTINISSSSPENQTFYINYNPDYIKVFPNKFELLNTTRSIIIDPQKTGFTMLTIHNNFSQNKQIPIMIQNNYSSTKTGKFLTLKYSPNQNISVLQLPDLLTGQSFLVTDSNIQKINIRNYSQPIKERLKDTSTKGNIAVVPNNKVIAISYIYNNTPHKIFLINNGKIIYQRKLQ